MRTRGGARSSTRCTATSGPHMSILPPAAHLAEAALANHAQHLKVIRTQRTASNARELLPHVHASSAGARAAADVVLCLDPRHMLQAIHRRLSHASRLAADRSRAAAGAQIGAKGGA